MNKTFVPKDNQELPDNYDITIEYVTGKTVTIEVATHNVLQGTRLEWVTKDDLWGFVILENVLSVSFDKRFSKIVAIREKETREKEKTKPDGDQS